MNHYSHTFKSNCILAMEPNFTINYHNHNIDHRTLANSTGIASSDCRSFAAQRPFQPNKASMVDFFELSQEFPNLADSFAFQSH